MPSSYLENIPVVMAYLEARRPSSVLDVGVGYGKYGFLIRERLDNFKWELPLDGVEVFPAYLDASRVDAWLYDSMFSGEFLKLFDEIALHAQLCRNGRYDTVLMVDVLEHFDEAMARSALSCALDLGHDVIVSTPVGYAQGAVNGNEHETHRSEWPQEKLIAYAEEVGVGIDCLRAATPDSVIVVLSS